MKPKQLLKLAAIAIPVAVPVLAPIVAVSTLVPDGTVNMTEDPAIALLGMINSNPWIQSILALIVMWAGGLWITARAVGQMGLAFRWFASMTESKGDDRIAAAWVYWADAAEDLLDEMRKGRWRKMHTVIKRIQEDLHKPYTQRRTE